MKSRREKHQNLLRLFSKTFYPWCFFWEQAFNLLALAFINFIDELQKPQK